MSARAIALAFAGIAVGAVAAEPRQPCSDRALAVVAGHFRLDTFRLRTRADSTGSIVALACRGSPIRRGDTLAAIAYDDGGDHSKKLIVAVVDEARGRVTASHSGEVLEDVTLALDAGSFTLDTAPYVLAAGVRAFGLDMESTEYRYSGCHDGGGGPVRTLFVRHGGEIRPVLEDFQLSGWTFTRGGPACAPDPDKVVETTRYTLAVQPAATNGFADLRVTARTTSDDGKAAPRQRQWTLKYDGRRYPAKFPNGEPTQ